MVSGKEGEGVDGGTWGRCSQRRRNRQRRTRPQRSNTTLNGGAKKNYSGVANSSSDDTRKDMMV